MLLDEAALHVSLYPREAPLSRTPTPDFAKLCGFRPSRAGIRRRWQDREEMADVEAYVRKLRAPRF